MRKEVPEAVATCHRAGILVRMVTGDNIHTARHIARECGILTEGGLALEGPKFREMPEEQILELLPRLQVEQLPLLPRCVRTSLVCSLNCEKPQPHETQCGVFRRHTSHCLSCKLWCLGTLVEPHASCHVSRSFTRFASNFMDSWGSIGSTVDPSSPKIRVHCLSCQS